MNDNTNKRAVVAAIWENPEKVFGFTFRRSGVYWEYLRGDGNEKRGKIRLGPVTDGGELANVNVYYNGASRPEKCDVFTYLGDYVLNTGAFRDTLERCAQIYGIALQYTREEREALNRQQLAREVAPSLVEALRLNPNGEAGRYLTEKRGLPVDAHFGELSEKSLKRAADALALRGKTYTDEDFRALGLTAERAKQGYNLVIPYYTNGTVTGFVFRNVKPQHDGPKYLYSTGSRGAYCDALTIGEPAVFVEGIIDAVRMIQAGVKNVVAMGGAQLNERTTALLKSRNISQITYVPDLEFDAEGVQRTDLIGRAIDAFLSAKVDGEPVVSNLYVAELYAPDGADLRGLKVDADSFGKEHPDELADYTQQYGVAWWDWELSHLLTWAKAQDTINVAAFQSKFDAIYNRCANPYERERIKQFVDDKETRKLWAAFGVTPQSLTDRDEWNRNRDYNNRVKAAAAELSEAVEKGANPATVGEIVAKLADAQSTNTRDDWDAQLNETFDDELDAIRNQPDTLQTKWVLGNVFRGTRENPVPPKFNPYERIEFWPADISVFCAPTSHGKTMILFQSAFDLVRNTDKTYIFVSCEENKRQLIERALNVFIDIPNTPDGRLYEKVNGRDTATGYCFKAGTRKKTIKAVIRGSVPPREYDDGFMGRSEHFDKLAQQVRRYIDVYGREVRPRLRFVHTDATTESITANLSRTVEELRAQGVEVGAVFVDYMQLLTSDNKNFSRHDELKDVCKALKGCAARLEIPVVIAAQLNRAVLAEGIDTVTVANIGEGADIERIAHDIYLVWQVDKTKKDRYFTTKKPTKDNPKPVTEWNYTAGDRATRIFTYNPMRPNVRDLKTGYLYVEQLKARDGKTDGWGLFPYDGERGFIGENDTDKMGE